MRKTNGEPPFPVREDSRINARAQMSERKFFKLKMENGKLKIAVGGVPPQSIREDSQIKELHQMPEYGIDAIFSLFMKL